MNNTRLFLCAAAVLWVLSFFFALPVVKPEALARLAALACGIGALGLAAGAALTTGEMRIPRSPLLLVAGLFWLNAALSLIWTPALSVSLISFFTFSLLPAGFLLALIGGGDEKFLRVCGWGAGIILAALASWAIFQHIFLPEMRISGRVRFPFADPNAYALVLALGFFPALSVVLAGKKKYESLAALLLGILIVAAVILLGARMVMVATLLSLFPFCWLCRASLRAHKKSLVLLVVAALAVFALAATQTNLARRLAELGSDGYTRYVIWDATLAMIAAHPWTGTGIGTFFLYYPQYRLPADHFTSGLMAHNDPLQFWAETGVIAPILFYLFIVLALWRMRKAVITPGIAGLFCALGVLVAHAHINFDLYVAPVLSLAGILLGLWFRQTGPDNVLSLRVRPVPAQAALMIGIAATLFLLQGLLFSEHHAKRARALLAKEDMAGFGQAVNAAHHAGFGLSARPYVLGAVVPLGLLEGQVGPAAERAALIAQTENLLAQAEARNERLASIPYFRARLAQESASGSGEDFLRQALTLDPYHFAARRMLIDLLIREGRMEEMLAVREEGAKRARKGEQRWELSDYGTNDF